MPCPIPRRTGTGAGIGCFPVPRGLPVRAAYAAPLARRSALTPGGSASATSLSRPAQASLALRPEGSLTRLTRALSQVSGPAGYPTKPLDSYQIKPTTIWVEPSSTGGPRHWGALGNVGLVALFLFAYWVRNTLYIPAMDWIGLAASFTDVFAVFAACLAANESSVILENALSDWPPSPLARRFAGLSRRRVGAARA